MAVILDLAESKTEKKGKTMIHSTKYKKKYRNSLKMKIDLCQDIMVHG